MNNSKYHSSMTRLVSRRDRGFAIVAVSVLLATTVVLTAAMTIETSRKVHMVRL
jgi:hypothetical protein